MANINVRVDDNIEIKLKKEANLLGISLSDLVREKLTGETKTQPINELTLENRIKKLEEQHKNLAYNMLFQTRFLYQFAVLAANEETALKAWETAKNEIEER